MASADNYGMEQARCWDRRWRAGALLTGLLVLLMLAVPAQAGLGDLLDDLIGPIGDVPMVGDIVEPVVDPVVEDVVQPVAGSVVDPSVDQVLASVIDTVVNEVVPPVVETVPPLVETVPPVLPGGEPPQEAAGLWRLASGVSDSSGSPGEVLVTVSGTDAVASAPHQVTDFQRLGTASVLQTALVETGIAATEQQTESQAIDSGWLDGLTAWLRNSAGGLLDLLALPIRLLELLARALLTAGSGLIAPLSMLLAFTTYAIKDRRWARVRPVRSLQASR